MDSQKIYNIYKVCAIYKKFLKYVYPPIIVVFLILWFCNFKWISKDVCTLVIFISIAGEIGTYINYINYIDYKIKNML